MRQHERRRRRRRRGWFGVVVVGGGAGAGSNPGQLHLCGSGGGGRQTGTRPRRLTGTGTHLFGVHLDLVGDLRADRIGRLDRGEALDDGDGVVAVRDLDALLVLLADAVAGRLDLLDLLGLQAGRRPAQHQLLQAQLLVLEDAPEGHVLRHGRVGRRAQRHRVVLAARHLPDDVAEQGVDDAREHLVVDAVVPCAPGGQRRPNTTRLCAPRGRVPSWPDSPHPQAYRTPCADRHMVWYRPAATSQMCFPFRTRRGARTFDVDPCPICPSVPLP